MSQARGSTLSLQQGLAAVDPDFGACDMAGVVGGEEEDELGDLFGAAWFAVAEGDFAFGELDGFLNGFEVAAFGIFVDVGGDGSRANDVDADAVFGEFESDHFGEGNLTCLGAGIGSGSSIAEHAGAVDRGSNDHRTALFFQQRNGVFNGE